MERCKFCNGRVIKTSNGYRCMKSSCEGAKEVMQDGVPCEDCGEPMDYKDLDSYGRPKYFCQDCGITVTL